MSTELGLEADKVVLRNRLISKALDASTKNLIPFIRLMNPDFIVGRHHEIMAERLEAAERGEIKRLMIFMPPRSGKSWTTSLYYPAWCLGRNPKWQVFSVSYGAELAVGFGRDVRNLCREDSYKLVFPELELRADSQAANRWNTTKGGVYAAGSFTGGLAGKGANLGIIDDPLSEQDAFSQPAREHVIRTYPGGFRSRLQPGGRIVLTTTRWHLDDLAGHLLKLQEQSDKADKWDVISIPALLDEAGSRLLGWREGTSYWPEYWSTAELQATKDNTPDYQWDALYMQRPTVDSGAILKREYWVEYTGPEKVDCEFTVMSMDTAASTEEATKSNAQSAMTLWGIVRDDRGEGRMVMLAARKGRWDYVDLKSKALEWYKEFNPDVIIIEKKSTGQALIPEFRLMDLPVVEYIPDRDKDKVSRAHACTPTLHQGKVLIPFDRKWAQTFMTECAEFPKGREKDFVDTFTQACLWIRRSGFLELKEDFKEDPTPTIKKRRAPY